MPIVVMMIAVIVLLIACGDQDEKPPEELVAPEPTAVKGPRAAETRVAEPRPVDTATPAQVPTAIPTAVPAPIESTSTEATPVVADEPEPQQQAVPIKEPEEEASSSYRTYVTASFAPPSGEVSLEERILRADVIARASFRSVAPSTRQYDTDLITFVSDKHITAVDITFDIKESLKGDAGLSAVVEVFARAPLDETENSLYDTEAESLTAIRKWIANGRDTRWDSRDAILFLKTVGNSVQPI